MKAMYKSGLWRIASFSLLVAILAAFVMALITNTTGFAQAPTPTDDQVNRIAKQLYCPVCESTPLDVCPTEACRQWRELIRTMLAQGKSEAEIKQYFVQHYGARVLAEPPNRWVTYLVPAVIVLLGTLLLFRGFQMWLKKPAIAEVSPKESKKAKPAQDPYIAKLEEELKNRK